MPHSAIVGYRKEVRARNKLLIVDITRPPASSKKVHLKYRDIFHPSEQNTVLLSELVSQNHERIGQDQNQISHVDIEQKTYFLFCNRLPIKNVKSVKKSFQNHLHMLLLKCKYGTGSF